MTYVGRVLSVGFLCAILGAVAGRPQAGGPHWSGSLEVRDAVVEGDVAALTLVCRIPDRAAMSVPVEELVFEDPLAPARLLGTISEVVAEAHGGIRIQGRITVPVREYEHWMRGGLPRAYLRLAVEPPGSLVPIELRRDPALLGTDS